jgi:putative FmdB family regulatory protein
MPIYEYKCQKCGTHIEKRQSINDEPLKVCENCGGELEKLISLSGFQFKGAGWYVTDYSGKKSENGAKSDGAEKSSGSESTASTDGASKPSAEPKASTPKDTKTD